MTSKNERSSLMTKSEREKLLKDKRVVEEINRHLWIESEKAGFD